MTTNDELLRRIRAHTHDVPLNHELGLEPVDFAPDLSAVTVRLPYHERLIGNPETGALHGGAVTALMDAACGMAVFLRKRDGTPIATIDLRIDYLRAGERGRDVYSRAECYKLTRSVAFVRAVAYHDDERDPIAVCAGTFMRGTKGAMRTADYEAEPG